MSPNIVPDNACFPMFPAKMDGSPAMRLVSFTFAGGSVTALRPLFDRFPGEIEVWGAEYPGRGLRWKSPLVTSFANLAGGLEGEVSALADQPVVLFGYSFGAVVAYEMAHRLTAAGRPPLALITVGAAAPTMARQRRWHVLSNAQLMDELLRLGGAQMEILHSAGLLEASLPVVRADLLCIDQFSRGQRPPLPCPVLAICGEDDPLLRPEEMKAWLAESALPEASASLAFSGGHFCHRDNEAAMSRAICGWLSRVGHRADRLNGTSTK
jgi:surfactin synthase thioesterase subunit